MTLGEMRQLIEYAEIIGYRDRTYICVAAQCFGDLVSACETLLVFVSGHPKKCPCKACVSIRNIEKKSQFGKADGKAKTKKPAGRKASEPVI